VKRNVPVITAIRKCLDLGFTDVEVTALLVVNPPTTPPTNFTASDTISVLERAFSILEGDLSVYDVQIARVAFPNAKIREISPSVKLPGKSSLDFIPAESEEMVQIGIKDGIHAMTEEIKRGGAYTLKEWISRTEEREVTMAIA
jgi:hypothetical protein